MAQSVGQDGSKSVPAGRWSHRHAPLNEPNWTTRVVSCLSLRRFCIPAVLAVPINLTVHAGWRRGCNGCDGGRDGRPLSSSVVPSAGWKEERIGMLLCKKKLNPCQGGLEDVVGIGGETQGRE